MDEWLVSGRPSAVDLNGPEVDPGAPFVFRGNVNKLCTLEVGGKFLLPAIFRQHQLNTFFTYCHQQWRPPQQ
jgi:hypothetical protein